MEKPALILTYEDGGQEIELKADFDIFFAEFEAGFLIAHNHETPSILTHVVYNDNGEAVTVHQGERMPNLEDGGNMPGRYFMYRTVQPPLAYAAYVPEDDLYAYVARLREITSNSDFREYAEGNVHQNIGVFLLERVAELRAAHNFPFKVAVPETH